MSGHVCSIPKSVPTWSLSLSLSLSPTSSGIKVVSVVATNNNTLSNSRRSEDLFSCSYPWSRRTIMKAPAIFHLPSLEKFEENVDSRKHFISPRPKRLFFSRQRKAKVNFPCLLFPEKWSLVRIIFFLLKCHVGGIWNEARNGISESDFVPFSSRGIFLLNFTALRTVWPDWVIFCTLGNHSKLMPAIILPKSPKLLGNFC